jgi:hypothetical protein
LPKNDDKGNDGKVGQQVREINRATLIREEGIRQGSVPASSANCNLDLSSIPPIPSIVWHRHSVLHDAMIAGNIKLPCKIAHLTVSVLSKLAALRRVLTNPNSDPNLLALSSDSMGNCNTQIGQSAKLSGYYGAFDRLGLV